MAVKMTRQQWIIILKYVQVLIRHKEFLPAIHTLEVETNCEGWKAFAAVIRLMDAPDIR